MTSFVRHCAILASMAIACALPLARTGAQSTPSRGATAAPLSADDSVLVTRERAQWQALKDRDTVAFARAVGSGAVDVDLSGIRLNSPRSTAQYVTGCQLADFILSNFRVARFSAATVVTYKAEVNETCWGQKAPSPVYVMSVYERQPAGWSVIAHSETAAAKW